MAAVDVVYTPYPNLKKTGDMVAGQVGFHKNKRVVKVNVEKNNEVCESESESIMKVNCKDKGQTYRELGIGCWFEDYHFRI